MDHVTTGEVDRTVGGEEATTPDAERVDRIDDRGPQGHEWNPGLEVDPPEHRSQHQDWRDRGEYELEVGQGGLREFEGWSRRHRRNRRLPLLAVVPQDLSWDADEASEEALMCDAVPRRTEAHLEGPQHPYDEHDRERREGQHHAVDRPPLLHHAAIEHDEAGNAHQTDQRCRGHLPSVVSGA